VCRTTSHRLLRWWFKMVCCVVLIYVYMASRAKTVLFLNRPSDDAMSEHSNAHEAAQSTLIVRQPLCQIFQHSSWILLDLLVGAASLGGEVSKVPTESLIEGHCMSCMRHALQPTSIAASAPITSSATPPFSTTILVTCEINPLFMPPRGGVQTPEVASNSR
jgi:hypothetical protein